MKKLQIPILVLVCVCLFTQVSAQNIGIRAGLNLANMLDKDDQVTYSDDYKIKLGFHLGAVVEIPISDLLSVEPGLLLSTKGMRIKEEEDFMGITYKLDATGTLYYLDIPVNLRVGYDLGSVKIIGMAGPYVGIGLSGKFKSTMEEGGQSETETEDVEWGTDPEKHDLKRPDFGLNFGAGAQISAIEVLISYGLGLANIHTDTSGGGTMKHRVLGISLGYKFGI